MNQNYNTNKQIQKGFKTFVLTLSISLIIFSVAYFMLSNNSYSGYNNINSSNESIKLSLESEVLGESTEIIQIQTDPVTNNTSDSSEIKLLSYEKNNDIKSEVNDNSDDTTFGKIANTPVEITSRAVLAEGDSAPTATNTTTANTVASTNPSNMASTTQTTVSTAPVPESGVTEMTWGFALSLVAFALGLFVISKDPRKLAIKSFEKDMMR